MNAGDDWNRSDVSLDLGRETYDQHHEAAIIVSQDRDLEPAVPLRRKSPKHRNKGSSSIRPSRSVLGAFRGQRFRERSGFQLPERPNTPATLQGTFVQGASKQSSMRTVNKQEVSPEKIRPTLLVIPDTNVLFSDPFLEGALIKTILVAENQTGIRLVIPEVVIDELRNHVEKRLDATINASDKVRRDYAGLSGLGPYAIDFMISADQRQAVLNRFDQRKKELDNEGRIIGYPSVSPKELAHRSIKRQLPFQNNDRGMRDTLIWLTAKTIAIHDAGAGLNIILVTEDGAFWDKDKGKLKEDLTKELDDAGIANVIAVRPTLRDVLSTFVSGKLPPAEWVRVAINGGQIDDFTASDDAVLIKAADWILENPDILEVGGYIFVDFDVVEGIVLDNIERTLDLGDGEALVESKWTCSVAAEGHDNPYLYFGQSLRVELQLSISSIVKVDNDYLSVQSHEVTEVEVSAVFETQSDEEEYELSK